jgi:hypothetical protein
MSDKRIKELYSIKQVSKNEARQIVAKYHYLKNKDFLFMFAYGLFEKSTDELVGCTVFGRVNGISSTKGWFGISNDAHESRGIYELNRLVLNPKLNGGNITSFFLGNVLKLATKEKSVRAIISLADTSLHTGYIYQACNFGYYGMSDGKTDFYAKCENYDGYKLNPIGKTQDKAGVWLPRSRKHRYLMLYDKTIIVNYEKLPYPKNNFTNKDCCGGAKNVHDRRFGVIYTCPKCTGKLIELKRSGITVIGNIHESDV